MNCIFLRRGYGESKPKIDYADNFADNDWATIAAVCAEGLVPTTWKVGDQKAMTINGASYPIDIIGTQHDDYADGSGKAPFTFQMHNSYNATYAMNSTATNVGGWTSCEMRKSHLPIIRNQMPSEVQSAIKTVKKLTSAGDTSSTIETTEDTLFLLSEIEIFGSITYSKSGEGTQYEYYKNGGETIKNRAGAAKDWHTRSPYASSNNRFCGVGKLGVADYNGSNNALGVAFAFCFGNKVSGGTTDKEYAVTINELSSGVIVSNNIELSVNGAILGVGTTALPEGTQIKIAPDSSRVSAYEVYLNGALFTTITASTGAYYYTVTSNVTISVGGIDMAITTT